MCEIAEKMAAIARQKGEEDTAQYFEGREPFTPNIVHISISQILDGMKSESPYCPIR